MPISPSNIQDKKIRAEFGFVPDGSGQDTLRGGGGFDVAIGGAGNDSIELLSGFNFAIGDSFFVGFDAESPNINLSSLTGILKTAIDLRDVEIGLTDSGEDTIGGGMGTDIFLGGHAKDVLRGYGGDDFLFGNDGEDIICGGDGADWLFGGNHNDYLSGSWGEDALFGGEGRDWMVGGPADDILRGEGGGDYFVFTSEDEKDLWWDVFDWRADFDEDEGDVDRTTNPIAPPPECGAPLLSDEEDTSSDSGEADGQDADAGNNPTVPNTGLTPELLHNITLAAQDSWLDVLPTSEDDEFLSLAEFEISDLPGNYLGWTISQPDGTHRIVIDTDAAGRGWFVDPTPLGHEEFVEQVPGSLFEAADGGPAEDRVDLLTVMAHELGHVLSLPDLNREEYPTSVMANSLRPGMRRIPTAADPVWGVQAGASPLQLIDSHGETLYVYMIELDPRYVRETPDPTEPGLANVDFSVADPADPMYAWTTRGAGRVENGQAVLDEGTDFFTGFSQTFIVPEGTGRLQFTVVSTNLGHTTANPPDAFEVALLDAATLTPLVTHAEGLTDTDAFLNVQPNSETYASPLVWLPGGLTASGDAMSWTEPVTLQVDLTGVSPGTIATLYFDLLGFGDLDSEVVIDEVFLRSLYLPPTDVQLDNTTVDENAAGAVI
ncbi:MAG: hypothetical protein JRF63_15350, partial [Deltaproteobacteria bacterium]|nr:hypothetical protein [Deltaproteobacteria bacterium]